MFAGFFSSQIWSLSWIGRIRCLRAWLTCSCPGILLLMVLVPLFLRGQRAAIQHNFALDSAAAYTARQSGTHAAQIAKNQNLRDKGYISEKEYDSRKENLASRKE